MEDSWNMLFGGRREDAHELFIRFERLANGKVNFHVLEVFKVGAKGGEVVGIIPLP